MMKIYLLRHLQTEWNLAGRLQGRKDLDILDPTVKDLEEIQKNKAILKTLPDFDLVLVSQLKRTQQTAKIYEFKDVLIESLLNELDFGVFEGQLGILLKTALNDQWTQNPRNLEFGERLIDLENRIINFLKKYQEFKTILIFGHGAWTRGLLSIIKYNNIDKMNTSEFKLNHNELLKVEIDEMNDRGYMGSWERL